MPSCKQRPNIVDHRQAGAKDEDRRGLIRIGDTVVAPWIREGWRTVRIVAGGNDGYVAFEVAPVGEPHLYVHWRFP